MTSPSRAAGRPAAAAVDGVRINRPSYCTLDDEEATTTPAGRLLRLAGSRRRTREHSNRPRPSVGRRRTTAPSSRFAAAARSPLQSQSVGKFETQTTSFAFLMENSRSLAAPNYVVYHRCYSLNIDVVSHSLGQTTSPSHPSIHPTKVAAKNILQSVMFCF